MRTPEEVLIENTYTEDWQSSLISIEDMTVDIVVQSMKQYAKEVIDAFVESYIEDINVHDKVIDLFKRQQIGE